MAESKTKTRMKIGAHVAAKLNFGFFILFAKGEPKNIFGLARLFQPWIHRKWYNRSMKLQILFPISLFLAHFCPAATIEFQSQVVGYFNSTVSQGVSRITVKISGLDCFPTLGDVLSFEPPEEVIGDTISFDLDGRLQEYVIRECNRTNAVLVSTRHLQPERVNLYGIPHLDSFLIRHISTKPATVKLNGAVASAYARKTGLYSPKSESPISAFYISPLYNKPRNLSDRTR